MPEYDPTKTAACQKKSVVEQKVSRLLSRSTVGSAESRSPRSARPAVANASVAANMPQDRTTQGVPPLKKVVPYHHDYSNAPEEPRSHPLLSIKRVVSYSRPSEEQANDIEMQDLGEVTSSVPSGTSLACPLVWPLTGTRTPTHSSTILSGRALNFKRTTQLFH